MHVADRGNQSTALIAYLQELRDAPFLSREEEARLAVAARQGREAERGVPAGGRGPLLRQVVEDGRRAEDRLAKAHLRLVLTMARDMLRKNGGVGISLEDLVSAGNEGLIEAIRRYDPALKFRLNTYARWWIVNKMAAEVKLWRWQTHIPDRAHRALLRIMRVHRQLFEASKREPTLEEVATELEMPPETVASMLALWATQDAVSLDRRIGEDGRATFADVVPDPRDQYAAAGEDSQVTQAAEPDLLRAAVEGVLTCLEPAELRVINLRFGLEDGYPRTLEDVGKELPLGGVTRERVRQIEAKALRKLRHPSRSKRLRDFVR